MIKLGVLDQSPIRDGGNAATALNETLELAKACERLGYCRYWLAEHHNTKAFAGSTPEVLIARVASVTNTIRVGSGGVMLPHYSPLKVAENFRMLEALFPGRIDLGIGRAPGSDPLTSRALQPGPQAYPIDVFPQQIELLNQFLEDEIPDEHPYRHVHAMPRGSGVPERWVLGSSEGGALFAAEFGERFCHAHFINADGGEGYMKLYRDRFTPSKELEQPYAALGVGVICADSEEEAERLAATRNLWVLRLLSGQGGAFPSVEEALAYPFNKAEKLRLREIERRSVVGTPEQCRAKLLDLGRSHGVDEFVVVTITYDFQSRLRSYELLAEAFELKAAA